MSYITNYKVVREKHSLNNNKGVCTMKEIVSRLTENRRIETAKEILESNGYNVSKILKESDVPAVELKWNSDGGLYGDAEYIGAEYENGEFRIYDLRSLDGGVGYGLSYFDYSKEDDVKIPRLTKTYMSVSAAKDAVQEWVSTGGFNGGTVTVKKSPHASITSNSWEDIPEKFPSLSPYVEAFNDIYNTLSSQGRKFPKKKFGRMYGGYCSTSLFFENAGRGKYLTDEENSYLLSVMNSLDFTDYEIDNDVYIGSRRWKTEVHEGDIVFEVIFDLWRDDKWGRGPYRFDLEIKGNR